MKKKGVKDGNDNPKNNCGDFNIKNISLEVDLESGQLHFEEKIFDRLDFRLQSQNIDSAITAHVDPDDKERVLESLKHAREGKEEPISFHFIHPLTLKKLQFEYKYEIVYVKYSSTRLQGTLEYKLGE